MIIWLLIESYSNFLKGFAPETQQHQEMTAHRLFPGATGNSPAQ